MPVDKPTPDKPRSSTRSPDSSEAHPSAPRPASRTRGTHEAARGAAVPQRVRNDRDLREERGGGLSQHDRESERKSSPGASGTATKTGGATTGRR